MEDYRQWKAMGQGGTSLDWTGYMSQVSAAETQAFGADETIEPGFYDDPEKRATGWKKATEQQKANSLKSFLKETLPAYLESFNRLGEINTDTEWKTSILEKHGQALFVKDSVPLSPLVAPASREICHIHGTDLSGHVTLSFVDAAEVISKGWGERHRLSGTDWVHLGFTMLYVPNTVEETEILINIFQAGIDYMKSG
ncbi:hypothetical protein Daesc_009716 [Daldinia eschscholtzii]|uniref:Luciferase domain-containing protein n=1 Tax=Daldinia eschscholtzii TaxID=292717 RepID=A0AAX6MAX7_9PEZI